MSGFRAAALAVGFVLCALVGLPGLSEPGRAVAQSGNHGEFLSGLGIWLGNGAGSASAPSTHASINSTAVINIDSDSDNDSDVEIVYTHLPINPPAAIDIDSRSDSDDDVELVYSPPVLSNVLVQASPVPPAHAPQFNFLNRQPWLVPYALPDDRQAFRNIHTVGDGYCGWASLGLASDGDQRQAVPIRAEVLAYVQQFADNAEGLEDVIYAHSARTAAETPLSPAERAEIRNLPAALTALPGTPSATSENGHLADLTQLTVIIAAVALNREIIVYTRIPGPYVATPYLTGNPGAPGRPLLIHFVHGGGHWEGLVDTPGINEFNLGARIHPAPEDESGFGSGSSVGEEELGTGDGVSGDEIQLGDDFTKPLTPKQLAALEKTFKPFSKQTAKEDGALSIRFTQLENCTESGTFYVKVIRHSDCLWLDPADYLAMLTAERQAVFDWVRTFDHNVQLEDIVIILLQRSTMDSIVDLNDGKCEEDVPPLARPSYLRTLLQQHLIRGLILPSIDSLFAHETTLLRLLVGDFNMVADDPCIPTFPIFLHSPSGYITDSTLQAHALVHALAQNSHTEDTPHVLSTLRHARLKRYMMGLSTQLSAPNRNRQGGRIQDHVLSRDAVRSVLAQLREIFGLATRPALSLADLDAMEPAPLSSAQSTRPARYRIQRWSHWFRQYPFRGSRVQAEASLQDGLTNALHQLSAVGKASPDQDWRAVHIGLSGRANGDDLQNGYCFPVGAARELSQAFQDATIQGLSLPNPESLLVDPSHLQRLLVGQINGRAGFRQDYPLHFHSPTFPLVTVSSWDLVRAIAEEHHGQNDHPSPGHDISDTAADLLHFLEEAECSRLLKVLATKVGGARGRNQQSRVYPHAPSGSYSTHKNKEDGTAYYLCTRTKKDGSGPCKKRTTGPEQRDAHYHRCAGLKIFLCHLCPSKFCGHNDLLAHVRTHFDRPRILCPIGICKKDYRNVKGLEVHIKKAHRKEDWEAYALDKQVKKDAAKGVKKVNGAKVQQETQAKAERKLRQQTRMEEKKAATAAAKTQPRTCQVEGCKSTTVFGHICNYNKHMRLNHPDEWEQEKADREHARAEKKAGGAIKKRKRDDSEDDDKDDVDGGDDE